MIRNPAAFAKRKAERLARRKRPETRPEHLSIKKDVLLNDGSKANVPVGDLIRIHTRNVLMKQVAKYPKAYPRFRKTQGK